MINNNVVSNAAHSIENTGATQAPALGGNIRNASNVEVRANDQLLNHQRANVSHSFVTFVMETDSRLRDAQLQNPSEVPLEVVNFLEDFSYGSLVANQYFPVRDIDAAASAFLVNPTLQQAHIRVAKAGFSHFGLRGLEEGLVVAHKSITRDHDYNSFAWLRPDGRNDRRLLRQMAISFNALGNHNIAVNLCEVAARILHQAGLTSSARKFEKLGAELIAPPPPRVVEAVRTYPISPSQQNITHHPSMPSASELEVAAFTVDDLDESSGKLASHIDKLDRKALSLSNDVKLSTKSTFLRNRLRYSMNRKEAGAWTTDDIDCKPEKKSLHSFMSFAANNFNHLNRIKHQTTVTSTASGEEAELEKRVEVTECLIDRSIECRSNVEFSRSELPSLRGGTTANSVSARIHSTISGDGVFSTLFDEDMAITDSAFRNDMDGRLHFSDIVLNQYRHTLYKDASSAYGKYPYIIAQTSISSPSGEKFLKQEVLGEAEHSDLPTNEVTDESYDSDSSFSSFNSNSSGYPEEFDTILPKIKQPGSFYPRFLGKKASKKKLEKYLTQTINGKATAHIARSFGLEPVDIDTDLETESVFVHTRPIFSDQDEDQLEKTRLVRALIDFDK